MDINNSYLIFVCIIVASSLSMWLVTSLVFFLFKKHNIVDKPDLYPHEQGRAPLPYPGGVTLVINMALWSPWILSQVASVDVKKGVYVLVAGLLTTLFMAWDDRRRSIRPIFRLMFQILVGVFFGVTAIKIGYMTNIFGGIIHLDQFEFLQFSLYHSTFYIPPIVVTCLWYVLVMNTINWSDNGRAMTSSMGLVTCLVLFFLSVKLYFVDDSLSSKQNSVFVISFLSILIPTLFVFRIFDTKRQCIVGDAGTMYIGFMIATLAIVSGGKMATVSIVLGMYVIDALYVVLSRIKSGKNPMKGDTNHLHHRMSEQGIDHVVQRRVVMLVSFIFGIGAIFLGTWGKIILFGVMITMVIYINTVALKMGRFLRR